jgi:hypothetical protein
MAMSYTALTGALAAVGSIRRLVNNPTIDPDDVLEDAQAEIYTRLRTREMRTTATLTGAIGSRSIALPADFLDPISLRDRYMIDIVQTDPDALLAMWATDASGNPIQTEPSRFAIFNEAIQFNVALDAAYTFTLAYFKRPAALASGNQTNFLTTRYPHLLRAACRKHAYIFLKNTGERDKANQELQAFLTEIAVQDDLSYRGFVPDERGT